VEVDGGTVDYCQTCNCNPSDAILLLQYWHGEFLFGATGADF